MSTNGLDMEDIATALNDVTKVANNTNPAKNEEAHALARDKGWIEPQGFDYDAYNASGKGTGTDQVVKGDWSHNAEKYEWKEEYGDVGPPSAELEDQLFRSEFTNRQGLKFDKLLSIKVVAEAEEKPKPISDFHAAGLHPVMVDNIDLCGYENPTPVQAYTIPAVLQSRDVIAVAQTGSGKTAAYLIPSISKLMGKVKRLAARRPNLANGFNPDIDTVRAEPLILVVAPTRELCCQIFDESRRLCYRSMLRPCVAYGGGPVREQREELAKGCDILVATPGRLIDFMSKPNVLSLCRIRYTIIDEADELLHVGWEADMAKIMSGGDTNEDGDHRYLLFSATFNRDMRKLARKYLSIDHIRIRIGRAGSAHGNVKQQVFWCDQNNKKQATYDLLLSMPPSRTMIFCNSKRGVDYLDDFLYNLGMPTTSIHSDRTQREREDALRAFRTGMCPILIATAVSGRGLDVRNVMHVINYDLPSMDRGGINEYVHRIGRTARIGNEGLASSFYNGKDEPIAEALIKILLECGQEIPDFLADHKPAEGEPLVFDDDSGADDDEAESTSDSGDAGGGGGGAGNGDGDGGDASGPVKPVAATLVVDNDNWDAGNDKGGWLAFGV